MPNGPRQGVVIYGGGMLGQQACHVASTWFKDDLEVRGFVDDTRPAGTQVSEQHRVLGSLGDVAIRPGTKAADVTMLFAIGYSDMKARGRAFDAARDLGYRFQTLVHPAAIVDPTVRVGPGTIVLAGTILDQRVGIEAGNYLDIGVKLGEDSVLGPNNYLAAGATLGGSVRVGRDNFIGLNATVVDQVTIGDRNFINAASLIHRDIGDDVRVVELREQRLMRNR